MCIVGCELSLCEYAEELEPHYGSAGEAVLRVEREGVGTTGAYRIHRIEFRLGC